MDLRHLLCATASTSPISQEGRKEPTLPSVNLLKTSSVHPRVPPHTVSPAFQLPTSVPIRQEPIKRVTFSQNENLDSIGTSTWQSRNPTKSVLLPRIRATQHKSDAEKASVIARSLKRKGKATDLEGGIQAIIDNRDDATHELAKLHGVSVKSLVTRVNATSNYHSTRVPNLFNALVSLSSVELNEGREEGSRLSLSEVQAIVRADMRDDRVSEGRKEEALDALKESRKVHMMGSRSSNVAAQGDARGTVDRMTEEVVNLNKRTGVMGLAFFVKGHIHDTFSPSIIQCNGSADFCLEVLKIDPLDLMVKFEQWTCSKDRSLARPDSLEALRSQCSTLISTGLRTISGIPNAAMNYRNYKRSIQLKHGVQLVGWPSTCPFKNPSQISTISSLKTIRNAVSVGVCVWKRMSEAEIAAIDLELEKEMVTAPKTKKVRKARAKNVKNAKAKASKTGQPEEDSDESNEGNGRVRDRNLKRKKGSAATDNNDSEDSGPPPKKKKPVRKQPQNKVVTKAGKSAVTRKLPPGPSSKEFISTSEDNSD